MKILHSIWLLRCLNYINTNQLIGASEDRVLWHRMVANVVNDGAATRDRDNNLLRSALLNEMTLTPLYTKFLICTIYVLFT